MVLQCQYVHRTKINRLNMKYRQCTDHRQTFAANSCCVCVFCPFNLDVKFVGSTSRGHTGFCIVYLPSAVRAIIFLARRIQPFISLVDREVDLRKNSSYRNSNSRPNVSEGYEVTLVPTELSGEKREEKEKKNNRRKTNT